MGQLVSNLKKAREKAREEERASARSDAIDQQIIEDSIRYKKECKILLLGSGGSGKSTIVKQMKILHQAGFDARERAEYRTTIYKNVLDSAATLARVVRRVGLGAFEAGVERGWAEEVLRAFPPVPGAAVDDDGAGALDGETDDGWNGDDDGIDVGLDPVPLTRVESRDRYYEYHEQQRAQLGALPTGQECGGIPTHAVLTPALADAIWHVARAPAVEKVVDFYLMDSARYFFSAIHRIADSTYVPSEEDILHARAESTAIIETRFQMGDLAICILDVSGQRNERRKWMHCFESVSSIIFCTALSEYDQVLEEEGRRVNRMRESLHLFDSVLNSRWFYRTSVMLFLNKLDVFRRKLPRIPLGRYFPEYTGGNDLREAAKYILRNFMERNRARLSVYPHVVQANDTRNIRLVFYAVKDTILQRALKDSGIV